MDKRLLSIAAIYGKKCADYGNCKSNRKRCSLRSYRNTAGNFEIWSGNEGTTIPMNSVITVTIVKCRKLDISMER